MERIGERPPGVIEDISPEDPLFHPDNADHYFESALNALRQIRLALLAAGRASVSSALDFGSGYGRVLRMLEAAFPDAALTACDVDRQAVDFCAKTFGATGVYSSARAGEVELPGRYDLIWSGSFFTHIDERGWDDFLPLLASLLNPGGVLVFTSAGRNVVARMRDGELAHLSEQDARGLVADYDREGFGFRPYPDRDRYGLARAAPSWVCGRIARVPGLLLLGYSESRGAAVERQDFVAAVGRGVPTP